MAQTVAQEGIHSEAKESSGLLAGQAPHLQKVLPRNPEDLAVCSHNPVVLNIF